MLRYAVRTGLIAAALLLIGAGLLPYMRNFSSVGAAQMQQRRLQMSDSRPSQTANYSLSADLPTAGMLGSIRVEFCSNLALLYYPCTPPAGFDISGASLTAQAWMSGFVVDAATTANVLVLSRAPAAFGGGPVSFTLSGVINQASEGSGFARLYSYASDDATGPVSDDGALAYDIKRRYDVSAEVPPYLTMCAAVSVALDCSSTEGSLVQMGEYSTARASTGRSQVSVATNAENGYTVRVVGQTMTSGNTTIPALSGTAPSRPGSSQFGINLRANSVPGTGTEPEGNGSGFAAGGYAVTDRYRFVSGEVVAADSDTEDYRRYTISYLVNISREQPPGVYSGTFSYIALGNF